jgi:hypothetical protein
VLFTRGLMERALHPDEPTLRARCEDGSIHYGDPPRHGWDECPGGDTMNCDDLRVLAYWRSGDHRAKEPHWVRVPEVERDLPDLAGRDEDGP